jgi:inosine-uridine nucleoside N-ribohydrolase
VTPLVIDTDPGVDDAKAIMLALAHPGVTVHAITVVAGNVGLDRTVANACTILDALGAPHGAPPVFAGCGRPLLGSPVAATSHGSDGLGDSGFPASTRPVESEHAALALARVARASPGALTLVTIGPLTNLAVALTLDPDLPRRYRRLVVMGGAVRATGNMPTPSTEFNVHADPEAAAIVLERWPDLTLVPWETVMRYPISLERLDELTSGAGSRALFLRRISRERARHVRAHFGVSGIFAADPLAMAVAVEPGIVTRSERRRVTVELAGRITRGQTTVDWFGLGGGPPNADVILEINGDRFWQLMKAAVV